MTDALKVDDPVRIRQALPGGRTSLGVPCFALPWIYGKVVGFSDRSDSNPYPIVEVERGAFYFVCCRGHQVEKVTHRFSEN
jgi:hypothetical protein